MQRRALTRDERAGVLLLKEVPLPRALNVVLPEQPQLQLFQKIHCQAQRVGRGSRGRHVLYEAAGCGARGAAAVLLLASLPVALAFGCLRISASLRFHDIVDGVAEALQVRKDLEAGVEEANELLRLIWIRQAARDAEKLVHGLCSAQLAAFHVVHLVSDIPDFRKRFRVAEGRNLQQLQTATEVLHLVEQRHDAALSVLRGPESCRRRQKRAKLLIAVAERDDMHRLAIDDLVEKRLFRVERYRGSATSKGNA